MEHAKRESILGAAARAFTRLGYRKASVDEIARAAGVAKGTIYLACESKEDLFYQAIHREVRAWIAEMSKLVDPRAHADELLRAVAERSLGWLGAHALVRDLLLGAHHATLPGWTERLEQLRSLGTSVAVEILELGVRQGRFRADLDVDEAASLLQDLQVAGLMTHARPSSTPEAARRRANAAMALVLDGLRTRAAPRQ